MSLQAISESQEKRWILKKSVQLSEKPTQNTRKFHEIFNIWKHT